MNGRYDRMLWSDAPASASPRSGRMVSSSDAAAKHTSPPPCFREIVVITSPLTPSIDLPMLRRCHRAAHTTVPMTSVQRFDQPAGGIAVRRSLGGSAASPLVIQPEAASSAASPRFTMSSVLNRMPSAVSRHFGCASQQELELHAELFELLSHRVLHDGARFNIRLNGDSLHVPADRFGFFTQRRTHPRKGAGFRR